MQCPDAQLNGLPAGFPRAQGRHTPPTPVAPAAALAAQPAVVRAPQPARRVLGVVGILLAKRRRQRPLLPGRDKQAGRGTPSAVCRLRSYATAGSSQQRTTTAAPGDPRPPTHPPWYDQELQVGQAGRQHGQQQRGAVGRQRQRGQQGGGPHVHRVAGQAKGASGDELAHGAEAGVHPGAQVGSSRFVRWRVRFG